MNSQHALVGVLGFVLGILFQSLYAQTYPFFIFLLFTAVMFLCIRYFDKKLLYTTVSIFLCAVALGMVRTYVVPERSPEITQLIGTRVELEGVVVADPDIRETTQRLTVAVENENATMRILVVAPLYPEVSYGDVISVSGTLAEPKQFETPTGRVFDYQKFLAKDGIFSMISFAHIEVLAHREGIPMHVLGFFSDIKQLGVRALSAALPEPQSALASGLLLGGKQGLGKELLSDFITVGLIHIVVLSGYNVMIVAEFILRLFGFLKRRIALACAAFTIAIFVFIAGAGAASVRAGVMAGIALFARATGKKYDAARALLFAGVLMLLWNPLTLAYDVGFQLSFIATLGLIFGVPIIEKKITFIKNIFLREIVATTLAAQISVLPLLLYQNGLFSVVALPANIIVLPVVPFAMLASFIALLGGVFETELTQVIALPAYALLSYITSVVEFLARVPLAAFSIPSFPFFVVILSYLLLGIYTYQQTKKLHAHKKSTI